MQRHPLETWREYRNRVERRAERVRQMQSFVMLLAIAACAFMWIGLLVRQ